MAGFVTFSAVAGTVSAVVGVLAVVIAALTSPIFLVVAAFAALFLAYQKNFLGFADGVNASVGFIRATLAKPSRIVVALSGPVGF